MRIDLKDYFEERDSQRALLMIPGPFVTISRQYGCEAHLLAGKLIHKFSEFGPGPLKRHPWKYISKEIISESAKLLDLLPWDVEQRIISIPSGDTEEFFASFRHYYGTTDRAIIEKIKEIITTYATKGNVIIIGLGGAFVSKDLPHGLRIRLTAPEKWRVERISEKMKISQSEAMKIVTHFDENRVKWSQHLAGRDFDESAYDLVINVKHCTVEEMVEIITRIMQIRKMIAS